MVSQLLGGVGLFLLGMSLLTDGLKALAGDALQRVLSRFAGGSVRAVLSGAVITALVQSSSATTLTTIGFVSAGLLTLTQAIGVVMGANLGTTSTAWLVSAIGLKWSVSKAALPLVGAGALGRILARDRLAAAGNALAGFGLVFVGIDTLQGGMAELASRIDPATLPGSSAAGRLLLVLLGAAMTVLMQSSSAAVTTTLAAVEMGTISMAQAAALVVGQNIGTTASAGIAAIGASVPARRTALAHVLFNGITGALALALLPLFVRFVARTSEAFHLGGAAVTLALFHTAFNVLGVALLLPLTRYFARLIEHLVPERGSGLTRHLDPSVTHVPAVAVEAARRTLLSTAALTLSAARGVVQRRPVRGSELHLASDALDEVLRFLSRLRAETESAAVHESHLSCLHAVDHLRTLVEECREAAEKAPPYGVPVALESLARELDASLDAALGYLGDPRGAAPQQELSAASQHVSARRQVLRAETLRTIAAGALDPALASAQLDWLLRLERIAYASWRALFHLDEPRDA